VEETHGSSSQCVSFSLIDVGSGFTANVVFLLLFFSGFMSPYSVWGCSTSQGLIQIPRHVFFYRTHLLSICLVLSWLVVTRIRQFAREHHLIDRPHAFLWLAKCYAVPSMYACQIWGTHFMKKGSELDSPLQTAHMCFLKGVLCVKRTKPNWAVLQECGQEPLQFYCIRAAAKFLNSLLNGKSACSRRLCIQILLSMLLTKIARLRSS